MRRVAVRSERRLAVRRLLRAVCALPAGGVRGAVVWHRSASEIGRTWFPWRGDRPASETVYLLIMTAVGLLLFVFLIAAEGYLRRAVRDGRFAGAYLRAASLLVAVTAAGALALEVALRLRRT